MKAGPKAKVLGVYDNENYTEESISQMTLALNKDNPDLLKTGRIELRLIDTPKGKASKKSKICKDVTNYNGQSFLNIFNVASFFKYIK